jgi:hypothetical protein
MLSTAAPAKSSTDAPPAPRPAGKLAPPASKTAPKVPRRQKVSGLRYAGQWLVAFSKTRAALWTGIAGILLFGFAIPFLFPSLFPSELRTRGQKVAQAWLARDAEQLRSFTDPTQVEHIPRWLEATPPPDLNEDQGKAEVSVNVERNDGDSAEILIQIKAAKANGTPSYFVYRHRWVLRKDTWYLQPDIPAAGTGGTGKGGKK